MSQVAGHTDAGGTSSTTGDSPSVGELFSHITEDISTLMRQEVALARAEATQSAKKAGKGAGLLAGAGVAGHFVLLFLSLALWRGLGTLMDGNYGLAAVIVAVIWAVIAAVMAAVGRKQLKQVDGLPRTADTVKKAPNALKGQEELNR